MGKLDRLLLVGAFSTLVGCGGEPEVIQAGSDNDPFLPSATMDVYSGDISGSDSFMMDVYSGMDAGMIDVATPVMDAYTDTMVDARDVLDVADAADVIDIKDILDVTDTYNPDVMVDASDVLDVSDILDTYTPDIVPDTIDVLDITDLGMDVVDVVDTYTDTGCMQGATIELSEACGLNGNGTLTQICMDGVYVDSSCNDPDECEIGMTPVEIVCGVNGLGVETIICTDGQYETLACTDDTTCVIESTKEEVCGLNELGTQQLECITGYSFEAVGECSDDTTCVIDEVTQAACGLNGNGTKDVTCLDGYETQTISDCVDPDECTNGETLDEICGPGGAGNASLVCIDGTYEGPCVVTAECGAKYVLDDALVLSLPFEVNSDLTDVSDAGNDSTFVGGSFQTIDGVSGYSFESSSQFIESTIPYIDSNSFSITVDVLVYEQTSSVPRRVVTQRGTNKLGEAVDMRVRITEDGYASIGGIGSTTVNGETALEANTWYELTFERSGDQGNIYINGQLDKNVTLSSTTSISTCEPLTLGACGTNCGFDEPLNGMIGSVDVKIYK